MIKINWSAIIIILLLGFVIFLQLRSCDEKETPDIVPILEAIEQSKKDIAEINSSVKDLIVKADSIRDQRVQQTNYYNYEISKLDSAFKYSADSLLVNSVLRYWTARLYRLSDFFQSSPDNIGITDDSQNDATGGKLVLPGK